MQTWQQIYSPLGSLGVSALAAVIPIVFFFLALAVFRLKGHVAGSITPVPGGVGPMTVAMLVANTLRAAEQRNQESK